MVIAFTVDVEPDVPPFLNTWKGVKEGLPRLIDILEKIDVPATFFITGKTCETVPDAVRSIPKRFEIACHGYEHERFDLLNEREQEQRIRFATRLLHDTAKRDIVGFRAPNFKAKPSIGEILKKCGYLYDSSWARYHLNSKPIQTEVVEIPNTVFSSILRLPSKIATTVVSILAKHIDPVVLDYHVWEIVEMKNVRYDCRFATGEIAFRRLKQTLSVLKEKFEFEFMRTIAKQRGAGRAV